MPDASILILLISIIAVLVVIVAALLACILYNQRELRQKNDVIIREIRENVQLRDELEGRGRQKAASGDAARSYRGIVPLAILVLLVSLELSELPVPQVQRLTRVAIGEKKGRSVGEYIHEKDCYVENDEDDGLPPQILSFRLEIE